MRRRHQLRPDTFPFLAVLLCAMGSLILVLMELDRRARSQAHTRAEAAWKKTQDEQAELLARLHSQRLAERDAEIERRRQSRETRLASHEREIRELQKQAVEASAARAAEQQKLAELLRALQVERERQTTAEKQGHEVRKEIEQARAELTVRQQGVEQARKKVEAVRSQREHLSGDLLLIEEALARLKEQRQRESRTWSVVPYVGKRGLNRRPMYVECDDRGLVFHPEKTRLDAERSEPVRDEVSRRRRQFREKRPGEDPYWMLLVRPDGIASYYQFLQAVRPLEVSYGYEFIDPGWDLDFPDPATLPAPVEVAAPLPSPTRREPPHGAPPLPRGTGGQVPVALGGPNTIPGAVPGVMTSGSPGVPAAQILVPRPGGGTGSVGGESGVPSQPGGHDLSPGGGRGESPGGGGSPGGEGSGGASAGGVAWGEPPGAGGPPGVEGSGGASIGTPSIGAPAGTRSDGPSGSGVGGEGKSGSEPPNAIPPETPTEERKPGQATIGNSTDGSSSPPLKPAARNGSGWVLIVDCKPDGVKLSPSSIAVPLDELIRDRGQDARLARVAREMIQRRRALQRPGEPPVPITIRFLVHKDGLRSFHLAYPLLDGIEAEKRAVLANE